MTTVGYWEAQVKLSIVVTPTWVQDTRLKKANMGARYKIENNLKKLYS